MCRSSSRWPELTWLKRLMLVIVVCVFILGSPPKAMAAGGDAESSQFSKVPSGSGDSVVEVSPPQTIQQLHSVLDSQQPKIKILSPRPNQVIQDNSISVNIQVEDLEIFQDSELGMGPHLHLFIDDQPYQAVYDLTQPVLVDALNPGTHTIRVLAAYPWLESFKNKEAYAQVTFHVFTQTRDNHPDTAQPLLTYNEPQDHYGSEPVMLDFYLNHLPENGARDHAFPGKVRVTVNDTSFVMDKWKAIYLQGLNEGKNWVRLELLDEQGNTLQNVYNDTIRLIDFKVNGQDTLSKIVRGELSVSNGRGIVDPNYIAEPEVEPQTIIVPTDQLEPNDVAAPDEPEPSVSQLGPASDEILEQNNSTPAGEEHSQDKEHSQDSDSLVEESMPPSEVNGVASQQLPLVEAAPSMMSDSPSSNAVEDQAPEDSSLRTLWGRLRSSQLADAPSQEVPKELTSNSILKDSLEDLEAGVMTPQSPSTQGLEVSESQEIQMDQDIDDEE